MLAAVHDVAAVIFCAPQADFVVVARHRVRANCKRWSWGR